MSFTDLIDDYLRGPQQLRDAVAGMTAEEIDAAPVAGKWSSRQVICHIADFEPVYVDRIKRCIAEESPPLRGGDPVVFASRLAYGQRDIEVELLLIETVRKHLATILQALGPDAMSREGIHSVDGPMTVEALLKRITGHIPHHITFIEEKRAALAAARQA